jgi:anti-sigma regulatory factor (Ser/Thr protein kinase)
VTPAADLHIAFCSDAAELPGLRARVRDFCAAHRWAEQQIGEIVLALDEAVTNIIRHGYDGAGGQPILLDAGMRSDPIDGEQLEIRVRDFGRQVDPAAICGRALGDVRPGGLGVHIMRAMMSAVEYRQADGGGMLVILRKARSHAAADTAARGSA